MSRGMTDQGFRSILERIDRLDKLKEKTINGISITQVDSAAFTISAGSYAWVYAAVPKNAIGIAGWYTYGGSYNGYLNPYQIAFTRDHTTFSMGAVGSSASSGVTLRVFYFVAQHPSS